MYKILDNIDSPDDIKKLNREDLLELGNEIRHFLINSVSKTGGHLSSNLGIVELSIVLHRVFNSPTDKIIFDVGHQGYVHKILTGRREEFSTLRRRDGISGFLKRTESEHDHFDAGHASTSISVAAGFSKAGYLTGKDYHVVCVIGDGAMTGGMAFEALNYLGHRKENVIVILNDNEMSIDSNVGGMSKYLGNIRTSQRYYKLKSMTIRALDNIPGFGDKLANIIRRIKGAVKYLLIPGMFFEDLGFTYIGPINGHNIDSLEHGIKTAKKNKGPVLVHVVTKKGKGYAPAEENPGLYHGVAPFDPETGVVQSDSNTFSDVFGKKICLLAKEIETLCAITAAMPDGTGLSDFKVMFPDRYIDVGIAEQHAVTMAAGMAVQGLIPIFAVYSTFLQRGYDQILHDVCIQNIHVVFCIDRAGLVGQDGETHHGVFDIAYLRNIPNMTILAPSCGKELEAMLEYAVKVHDGPIAVRYPRGESDLNKKHGDKHIFETDEMLPVVSYSSNVHTSGDTFRVAVIAAGNMLHTALSACDMIAERAVSTDVINPKCLHPVDLKVYAEMLKPYDLIVTVEDAILSCGFGEMLKASFEDKKMINIGYPDIFIPQGEVTELMEIYGLNGENISKIIIEEFYRSFRK